ncbi:MAG: PTS transporter subunit IIC [Desulfurococcaceae archaeon]
MVLQTIMDILIQVITSGPLLIALIVWVGHILKGSTLKEQLLGAARAAIGVLGLTAGANLIVGVLTGFQGLLQAAVGMKGYFPGCYAMYAYAMTVPEVTRIFGLILLGGFLIHLLLARITPWRFVYLTPHGYLWIVTGVAIPFAYMHVPDWLAILIGAIVTGIYYTYSCAVAYYDFKGITGGERLTIGHPGGTSYFLAGLLGRIFKGTKRAEEVKVPTAVDWMRDITLSTSVVMLILFLILLPLAAPEKLEAAGIEVAIAMHPVLWSIVQALTFGTGILVIMTGVRMMLREITVSFEGIARKAIPGGIPGLDCPASFPFGESAVMLGFVGGVIGSVATSLVLAFTTGLFIIPPVVEDFFMAGTCGVYGNYKGGWKGAIAGGIMKGIFLVVFPALSAMLFMQWFPTPITHADIDANLMTLLAYGIAKALGYS